MACSQKFGSMEAKHCTPNFTSSSSSYAAWNRKNYRKTSETLSSSLCRRTKGKKSNISNHGGITPLSIAGKILARVLLDRLVPAVSKYYLPESLCGFRANMGTTDMVFVLRQLQEKCREQNKGLYITFVNPSKAFDTVSRKGLWKIMERLGCPPKFLSMVMQLHEDRCGQIRNSNELSEPFPILNGVKQGCVLVPTLFTIFFNIMLQRSHRRSRRR